MGSTASVFELVSQIKVEISDCQIDQLMADEIGNRQNKKKLSGDRLIDGLNSERNVD